MATLTFDQTGLPAGTTDRSRSDIVAGTVVTITASAGTTHAFELLWKPPEDTTGVLAGAGDTRTLTPQAGVSGTYIIRATVDGVVVVRAFQIKTSIRGLLLGGVGEFADRFASLVLQGAPQIAAAVVNEAFGPFSGGSAFGWWRAYETLVRAVDDSREIGPRGSSATEETTSGTVLITKASIIIPDETGTWFVVARSRVGMSNTNGAARTMLANITDAATTSLETLDNLEEMKDTDNRVPAMNQVEFANIAGNGAKQIALRYAVDTGGTMTISDAYIDAFKVS